VFERTPEGMAGVSAKSAFWLCHSYGVKWPGWLKALFFQRGDSASGMNLRGTTPWGAPPQKAALQQQKEEQQKADLARLQQAK